MSLNLGILSSAYKAAAPNSNLLLDDYPNAKTAISFRKLRSAYTGNCIQIRRSNDNATQDIGFINNVLDTTTLLTFVGANSGYISVWYDQSGNGYNFIENTAANQPAIVISGVLQTLNGKPAAYFNGTTSHLKSTFTFTTQYFFFDVLKTSDTNFILYYDGNGGTNIISVATQGSSNTTINYYATVYQYFINNTLQTAPTTRNDVYNLISTNNQILLTYNTLITTWFSLELASYNSWYFQGFRQELVIYQGDISANRSAINTNINSFYTIY